MLRSSVILFTALLAIFYRLLMLLLLLFYFIFCILYIIYYILFFNFRKRKLFRYEVIGVILVFLSLIILGFVAVLNDQHTVQGIYLFFIFIYLFI
jgi:hypothetical protein